MLVQFSGARNGLDWPSPGAVVDLPDVEAAKYVRAGFAVSVEGAPVESAVVDAPVESARVVTVPRNRAPRSLGA